MQRMTAHFTGHVQGVGFRATTQRLARKFNVAGYVQNLRDGRVRLVAEGSSDELDALLAAVRARMDAYIHDVQREDGPATGEFGPPAPGALGVRY